MTNDGKSFLFAETWGCRISRYWFAGPKQGAIEVVMPTCRDIPTTSTALRTEIIWCALVGMRSPALRPRAEDAAVPPAHGHRVAPDEWLFPNMNTGCVVKFDLRAGSSSAVGSRRRQPSDDHLDARAQRLPLSRRHLQQSHRQLTGFPAPTPIWTGTKSYWGRLMSAFAAALDRFRGGGEAAVTVPPMDGALRPNSRIEDAPCDPFGKGAGQSGLARRRW